MVDIKSVTVNEIKQRVNQRLNIDLDQEPKEIDNWFTSNVVGRTFAYLVGLTHTKIAKYIEVTHAGAVKVANTGAGFEHVRVLTGVAGATESTNITFTHTVSKVRFVSVDFDMLFRPSHDGVIFHDQIYIFAGRDFTLDLVCKTFRVQRVGVNDARYRIEGYR